MTKKRNIKPDKKPREWFWVGFSIQPDQAQFTWKLFDYVWTKTFTKKADVRIILTIPEYNMLEIAKERTVKYLGSARRFVNFNDLGKFKNARVYELYLTLNSYDFVSNVTCGMGWRHNWQASAMLDFSIYESNQDVF